MQTNSTSIMNDGTFLQTIKNTYRDQINIAVFNSNNCMIYCSQESLKYAPIKDSSYYYGLSYNSPERDQIKEFFLTNSDHEITRIMEECQKIASLQEKAMKEERAIHFIDLLSYNKACAPYICTINPIFSDVGQVIGNTMTWTDQYMINIGATDDGHKSKLLSIENIKPADYKGFTQRQYATLFLLANNFTQLEIAEILGITRGTVSQVINMQLCPKFGLLTQDSVALKKLAIDSGIKQSIPASLWPNKII